MDIPESKHLTQAVLFFRIEATFLGRGFGVVVGPKKNVPDREIRVILGVMSVHMMHAMGFWTLEDRAKPAWSADIPMVEKFCDRSEKSIERGRFYSEPKNRVSESRRDQRVNRDFDGVLIEAGKDFDSLWRVVQLMAETPE
jgi:hypothetical protein|tara:strand:- start:112 stop:534 length:423 start_codon:yes stop_codon:yes gene_type:complete